MTTYPLFANRSFFAGWVLALLLAIASGTVSHAATITKAATGTDLAVGASWGGTTPGSADVATWISTSLGASLTLDSNASWGGIAISGAQSAIGITGAGTLTLGSGGIDMSTSTVNLTVANNLALDANQTWNLANSRTVTASGIISGAFGLTKSGAGTLTLSGLNTYTGGLVINSGIVITGAASSVSSGGTGTGPITINSTGTLRLTSGVGTLNRDLTLNGGTLHFNGSGNDLTAAGTIALAANSTIEATANNSGFAAINSNISGAGRFTKTGLGGLRLNGTNSYTGPTVVSTGGLTVKSSLYGNDTTKWTPANITVANNSTLALNVGGAGEFSIAQAATLFSQLSSNVNNNGLQAGSFIAVDTRNAPIGTYTYSANITDSTGVGGGSVGFKHTGTANHILELTGTNTYTGLSVVDNSAFLKVSSINSVFTNAALGTVHSASSSLGAPTTVANGTIHLGTSGSTAQSAIGNTFQAGGLIYTGTGETTDRIISMNDGGGRTSTLDQSGTGHLKFISNFSAIDTRGLKTLLLQGSTTGTGEIAGVIPNATSNNTAVTKSGTGTWTLSGANLYLGATTVTGGALVLANTEALKGGIGATGGMGALTFNGGVIGLGVGDFSRPLAAAGTVGAVNFTGNGGWAAYGADRTVNLGGNVITPSTITWATANTGLNGKTLILGNDTATHTVDFQNPLDLGNAARTVLVDNGAAVIDGKLSGNITGVSGGNLTKIGTGTLSLTGTNNYVGTTTVSAGTLLVNGAKTGTGLITVASGASLGGTGSIAGATTFSSGGKAVFTVTPDPVTQANTTPLTIAGVMAFNATEVHLNLPANLPSGTYTLATSSATPTGTVAATPVVVSGSYVAGFTVAVVSLDTAGKKLILTVTVIPANEVCVMLTCNFGALGLAVIDEAARTVLLTVPPSQPVTALAPTFTLYGNATISPASGSTQDFTNPVVYRVTAENGVNFKDYTVSVPTFTSWAHSGSMFINTTPAGANVTGSVNDFPLLVRLNSSNFNFAQAQSDGRDLRFFTAAGAALPYQIEQWDSINGQAAVWVKIPTITGNSTQEIIMYWGKSGVASLSNGSSVFNSTNGYCSVMHLNGNVLDSTGSISPVNNGATPSTAVIGGTAMNLATGDISAANITNFPTGNNPASTGQLWFRPRKVVGFGFPLAWGLQNAYGWNTWQMQIGFWGSPAVLPSPLSCRGPATVTGSTALAANQWYHVVYTNSNGTGRLYINGVLNGTASGGSLNITNPQGLTMARADGDVDEARISNVERSADWAKLEYENQKPLQTLVGGIVPSGSSFSVTPTSVTMNELATTTLTAQAGGAQKVYWIYKKNGQETVLATDQLAFNYTAPRMSGNDSAVIQFKAVFAGGTQTIDVPLTVIDTVPDPVFTLVPSTTSWDGRSTMTVTANISNLAAMQAAGFGTLNYKWSVSGLAVTKQTSNGTLTLTRSQGSGPLNVTLTIDNGGTPVSNNVIINVQEPASDPWLARTPAADEKPVNKQFFARNPNTGLGTIFYNGTQSGTPDTVFLKVYKTPNGGSETLETTHRQSLVGGAYAFTAPITAGRITYRVVYGTTTGGVDTDIATVTDLVCGDAFIIEGQSNAVATDYGTLDPNAPIPTPTAANTWIRTYGLTSGWGNATISGNDLQLGLWGWILANRLVTGQNMPVCIINGAVGGTRIDQHRPNPAGHGTAGSLYSIYANLYNRVNGAKLSHGIRGLLWHQGEQNQGSGGIDPDYDYKFYQQYFVDISAAWKQDFPNLRNYHFFQIWPAACGDQSRNDQLREVQRTMSRLYSNMKMMSTHGIVPGSSCHYSEQGYRKFSDLIGPLVEQDVYGVMPTAKLTAPNLQQAYFTTPAKTEIALVFDQNVAWNPGAPTMLFLANSAGATSGSVSSGSATGNTIKLQVSGATSAATITYLMGKVSWLQPNILYGTNGIAALTFADVPVGTLSPYDTWAGGSFANAFTDTAATSDPDGDGQSNQEEFAFGLDPTTGSSVNPITVPLNPATGTFSYTRRRIALTGLTYTIRSSTTMASNAWTDLVKDTHHTESISTIGDVETVTITLTPVPSSSKLFVQVRAQ